MRLQIELPTSIPSVCQQISYCDFILCQLWASVVIVVVPIWKKKKRTLSKMFDVFCGTPAHPTYPNSLSKCFISVLHLHSQAVSSLHCFAGSSRMHHNRGVLSRYKQQTRHECQQKSERCSFIDIKISKEDTSCLFQHLFHFSYKLRLFQSPGWPWGPNITAVQICTANIWEGCCLSFYLFLA